MLPASGWSLSARRAWIEINVGFPIAAFLLMSLSARRAWIEILYQLYDTYAKVSLSARRAWIEIGWYRHLKFFCACRSPQGERG